MIVSDEAQPRDEGVDRSRRLPPRVSLHVGSMFEEVEEGDSMIKCEWEDSDPLGGRDYRWEIGFDEGMMDVVAYDASRERAGCRSDPVTEDTVHPADVTSIEFIHNNEGMESPARSYPKDCSYIILRCRNPAYGEWEYKWKMKYMGPGTPERLVKGLNAFLSASESQVVPKQLADLQKFAYVVKGGQGYVEYQPVAETESEQGAMAHFEFTSVKKKNMSMPRWLFRTIVAVGVVASIPLGIALSALLDAETHAIVFILCVWMVLIALAMFLRYLWGQFLSWRGSGTPVDTEVWIEGSTIRVAHKDPGSDAQGSPLVLPLGYIDSIYYIDSHKNGWIAIEYRLSDVGSGGTECWGLDLVDDDTRRQLLTCMDKYYRKYFGKMIHFG